MYYATFIPLFERVASFLYSCSCLDYIVILAQVTAGLSIAWRPLHLVVF
jgi:hypothetical protein